MLPQRYDQTIEKKWQTYWQEQNIYRFNEDALNAKDAKPIYSIDTPPPFTSGELHMGHVLSYSFFDFIARFKRMNGFNVYYPQGWDTQGFPTEVKVEKKFGRLPPAEFRQKCMEWTHAFIAKMKQQMIDLGFSPDWKYEYRTMDPEYHAKVQRSLIEMYNKKMIYRAEYPVYWCTKCLSAIAKAELDDLERNGTIYHINFTGPNGENLVIATTRPELIPACVGMAFHPDDSRYKALAGKKAKTPLGKDVPIFADKDVDKEFGTGILQICTFGDMMDVVWMHRHKLPMLNCINSYGKMQNAGDLDGLKIADARKKIVEKLETEGRILKREPLQQVVKVHDRCGTVVELLPSKQWFANIKEKAAEIKKLAQEVHWVPDFGISYLTAWVENAEWDWVISRQRVFGTPLPFYYCEKCNSTASAAMEDLPYYAEKAKPKQCKCGSEMKPETSTCDCWIDSSITPLIIAGWPEDKEKFAKLYPISLRPQGVEIVRTWAFYTIYRSGVGLTGQKPWETILLNGNVLAPDGKKMSKSLGNIISPGDLVRDYPVDAIRQWAAMSGAMAKDRPFSYEDLKYAKSFLTKLWNAAKLVQLASKDYDGSVPPKLGTIDQWMVSRLHQTVATYAEHFERFEYHHALATFYPFFWHDFCDNYLEYVKHRIYGENKEAKAAAQYVLRYVLLHSLKLLAPVAAHITEEIYADVFPEEAKKTKSIHRSDWPKAGKVDDAALKEMEVFNQIVSEIRQYKAKHKLAQNAELASVSLDAGTKLSDTLIAELKSIVKAKSVRPGQSGFSIEPAKSS